MQPRSEPVKRRARSDDDKARRRRDLLEAAEGLLARVPYEGLTVTAVAEAAGLSKASAYTYFPTKESLFLDLLGHRLTRWSEVLALRLVRRPRTPRAVARALAETLAADPLTRSLLGRLHATLETNVPDAAVLSFKRFLAALVAQAGAQLEHALPGLAAGDGQRLLIQTYALVIGLGTLADRPPNVARALEADPELSRAFEVDFGAELAAMLEVLIAARVVRQRA